MLPLSRNVPATRHALLLATLLLVAAACTEEEPRSSAAAPAPAPETAWVEIGRELFELELAVDPKTRFLGLGRRTSVAPDGGMLFVFPDTRPLSFVMRDCPMPLDVAFLDEQGRVLAIHEMTPEPPRRAGERPGVYEARLPQYASGGPARFAVEVAGGRLAQVGAEVGERLVFDAQTLLGTAR